MFKKRILFLFVLAFQFLNSYSQQKWAYVTKDSLGKVQQGILGENGDLLVPIIYEAVVTGNFCYFIRQHSLWGCYKNGKQIINPQYEEVGYRISENLIRVKKNHKWGYVDLNNKTIIGFKYDFACNFLDGKAYVKIGEKGFQIDHSGKVLNESTQSSEFCPEDLSEDIENRNQFGDGNLVVSEKDGRFGVIESVSRKVIIPYEFDEIKDYYNGVIYVKKSDKMGAFKDNGVKIAEPIYKSIGIFVGE